MKALKRLSSKPGDMKLIETAEPQIPKDDWIKVKVAYAGICGSDIKMLKEDCTTEFSKLSPPVIPGHESCGIVWEVGKAVKHVSKGDRVVYHTMVDSCGRCEYCLSGNWGLCKERKGIGSTMDGAFAEYLVCPARNVIKIPEEISLKTAVLVEPLACCIRIVEEVGKVKRGEKVVIFGPGTIGACCAIAAKANGAIPVVVGTKHSRHRLDVIEKMGITCLINNETLMENLNQYFGGPADVAIDAVGKETITNQAVDVVKSLGRVVIGAVDQFTKYYQIDFTKVFYKQLRICGSSSSTPLGWHRAVSLIKQYGRELEGMSGKEYQLEEWEEAYQIARGKEDFKILFRMQ